MPGSRIRRGDATAARPGEMTMRALASPTAPEATAGPVHGQVDGMAQGGLGAFGPHAPAMVEGDLDPALLVDATARAVEIGELDVDPTDIGGEAAQGRVEPTLHEVLERLGEGKIATTNIELHRVLLASAGPLQAEVQTQHGPGSPSICQVGGHHATQVSAHARRRGTVGPVTRTKRQLWDGE